MAKNLAEVVRDGKHASGNNRTPEVHNAQQRVHDALDRGEIEKPKTCSRCGKRAPVEAAHNSYSKRLDFKWLCDSCHRKDNAKNPRS